MEAFGGVSYNATTPEEIKKALSDSIISLKPTIINCVIDTKTGTECYKMI